MAGGYSLNRHGLVAGTAYCSRYNINTLINPVYIPEYNILHNGFKSRTFLKYLERKDQGAIVNCQQN